MKQQDNTLDERFRRWSVARKSSDAHLRQLTARIVQEARRRRRIGMSGTPGRAAPGGVRRGLAWFGLGAAAAACVVAVWTAAPWRPHERAAAEPDGSRLALISDDEAQRDRRLFEEMHRLFDKQLRWVAEFNGDVSVGVEDLPGGTDASARPVSVRLVVVARTEADPTWRAVWHGDLLLRTDERVRIAASRNGANTLTVWTHTVSHDRVAVEADVCLTAPVRVASRVDTVVAGGIPTEIAALRSGDHEYRVLQSVRVL
jgi:hypothetical protein